MVANTDNIRQAKTITNLVQWADSLVLEVSLANLTGAGERWARFLQGQMVEPGQEALRSLEEGSEAHLPAHAG